MSVVKSKVLLREAKRDIEVGCYNKAVSAAYFALRMVVERYLDSLGAPYSKKDDKLANTIQSLGMKEVAYVMRVLFQARKRADHSDKLFTLKETEDLLSMAESAWKTMLEAFRKKV
ncbi:MAG: HEPN domain-containing protein [Candidatus Freyarchaeota archaeon]|nr:HEPN domain-containing protein [Candidatus Jordarchaeia archaeon]